MNIVEFVERVADFKLSYYQKKYLTKLFNEEIKDDKCQECKKDWTKCAKCPVMMEWVKERKKMNKNKLLNGLTEIRKDLAERRGYDYSGVGYLEYAIQQIDTGAWKCDECDEKKPINPMSRADILDAAKKCVCGQREQDYGTPESNFQLIANLWRMYLGVDISATDVAMMMALMKIARIKNGGGTGDSFVDLAGYAACGGEINNYVRGFTAKEMEKVGTEIQKAIISGLEGDKICSNFKHFSKDFMEEPCINCSNAVRNADALLWEAKEDE